MEVLVAHNEYLIAMEVERIVLAAYECQVTICRCDILAETISVRRPDLVLLDVASSVGDTILRMDLLRAHGIPVAFLSAYADITSDLRRISTCRVFDIPFDAMTMIDGIAAIFPEAVNARISNHQRTG